MEDWPRPCRACACAQPAYYGHDCNDSIGSGLKVRTTIVIPGSEGLHIGCVTYQASYDAAWEKIGMCSVVPLAQRGLACYAGSSSKCTFNLDAQWCVCRE